MYIPRAIEDTVRSVSKTFTRSAFDRTAPGRENYVAAENG